MLIHKGYGEGKENRRTVGEDQKVLIHKGYGEGKENRRTVGEDQKVLIHNCSDRPNSSDWMKVTLIQIILFIPIWTHSSQITVIYDLCSLKKPRLG